MTTVPILPPSDQLASAPDPQYCPRCGRHRLGALRLCGNCRFDFETPIPDPIATIAPPTPSVRIVPSDAPPPPGLGPLARNKRWLLLGPIALL
jgi:rubredoxin